MADIWLVCGFLVASMWLTSYTAWWNRMEKEERKFYSEVERENINREDA